MACILDKFDLDLLSSSHPNSNAPAEDDLPVPRGILQARVGRHPPSMASEQHSAIQTHGLLSPPMDPPRERQKNPRRQTSDSGLGSSIGSTTRTEQIKSVRVFGIDVAGSQYHSQTAITRSISVVGTTNRHRRQLGLNACKQIERFILIPILKEERLKPFGPLVQSIPHRIFSKDITCLRDLEKTFIHLAPTYSASKASYIGFCEFSIQCIHTAASHLNQQDQRLPTDRPYTNGYFLDLVAQIRQYAAMMASAREQARAGDAPADVPRDERLTLEGGLSQTGRPAEFVSHKDGKAISLRTGEPYDEKVVPTMKRSLSTQSIDEGVERSMARRKKNAPPMDINQKCRDCDKVFKRPCDLTKHEKTHSRPWKCTEPGCKYSELGWPTEKERDRHINDRHSKAPPLYKCLFSPCTYQSKRESNCKQHMEKAHGWDYHRTKNKGKISKKGTPQTTPQTPNIATPVSNMTDLPTPISGPAPSPFESFNTVPSGQPFVFEDPLGNPDVDFPLFPDTPPVDDISTGVNDFSAFPNLDFESFQAQLEAGDRNDLVPTVNVSRHPDNIGASTMLGNSPIVPTDNSLNFDFDWSKLDTSSHDDEFIAMPMQLLTPAPSIPNTSPFRIPNLSPSGQGNLMLFTPPPVDEGFADPYNYSYDKPVSDFTLFDSASHPSSGMNSSRHSHLSNMGNSNMIPPLNTYGSGLGNQMWGDMDMEDY